MRPEFWKGKRVLVTGHNGFKGLWLSKWLDLCGAEVLGVSLAPEPESLRESVNFSARFSERTLDIRDKKLFSEAVLVFDPQIVFHLAAQPIVKKAAADPYGTFCTNAGGLLNLLEIFREGLSEDPVPASAENGSPALFSGKMSLRAVVVITSDKVYRNTGIRTGYREEDPFGGDEPYSASKACQEMVAAGYRRLCFLPAGIGLATARAANIFGGADHHFDRLIPYLIQCALDGQSPKLRNPDAIRPWQYITEPLDGYLMLAEALWKDPQSFSEGWNFGPDVREIHTVAEMAQMIEKAAGGTAAAQNHPDGTGKIVAENGKPHPEKNFLEAGVLTVDSQKSRDRLGWQCRLSLSEGLSRTCDFYRAERQGVLPDELMAAEIQAQIQRDLK